MSEEGFLTDLWTAEVFFRYCNRYHIEGMTARLAIMRRLVAKKQVKYIRDPKTFLKGKNVLKLSPKEPPIV